MKKSFFILLSFFSFNFLFSQSLTVIANPSIICPGYSSTLTAFGNSISINNCTWTASSNSILLPNINTTSIAITCSVQGTYTITCTAISGTNTMQAQAIVIVGPNLTIMVTANQMTTCIEENSPKLSKPVVLTASGANTYVWVPYNFQQNNGPTLTIRPSSTTCYTVFGNTSVCSGTASICVSVIPQFSMSVLPSQAKNCVGDQINLKMQNPGAGYVGPLSAFTYSWTDPQTISMNPAYGLSASVDVFPQAACTYSAEMKDATGCVSLPQFIKVTVEKCTELKQEDLNDSHIFPNPVSDILYLKNVNNAIQTIEFTDLNGRNIIELKNLQQQKDGNIQINLSEIENGFYFLKIQNENGKTTFVKITKQ